MVKIKLNYFSSLNHTFIVLCELLMPCQLFAQKCSNCQEITKISKCSGSPPPPPEHSAIGKIHRDILLLGILLLQYNMSFKTIAGGLVVLSDGMVLFLKIEKFFNKSIYTKTILWAFVALKYAIFSNFKVTTIERSAFFEHIVAIIAI